MISVMVGIAMGSSPLTRGKPREEMKRFLAQRLIPAHAGKTGVSAWRGSVFTAHPRSRGENSLETRNRSPV